MLYDDILRHRPAEPKWPGRDRFILIKGHGCLALYAVLADKGYFPVSELDRFCHFDSILGGHPEVVTPGVEACTGALGHGLAIGIGLALAACMRKRDHRIVVLMGEGEINEGSVWEAAAGADKHRLSNLTAIIDYNQFQSAGRCSKFRTWSRLPTNGRATVSRCWRRTAFTCLAEAQPTG